MTGADDQRSNEPTPEMIARGAQGAYDTMVGRHAEADPLALAWTTLDALCNVSSDVMREAVELMSPEALRMIAAQGTTELRFFGRDSELRGDDDEQVYLFAAKVSPDLMRLEVIPDIIEQLQTVEWAPKWGEDDGPEPE